MKVKCNQGFFTFQESRTGEAAEFMGLWDIKLAPYEDKYTFLELENPPEYSIEGDKYIGALCNKTHSGKPWEIFKANGLVFDFGSGTVIQKSLVKNIVNLDLSGAYYLSNGLILPGSMWNNKKIHSYSCFYNFDKMRFRYSEVSFD